MTWSVGYRDGTPDRYAQIALAGTHRIDVDFGTTAGPGLGNYETSLYGHPSYTSATVTNQTITSQPTTPCTTQYSTLPADYPGFDGARLYLENPERSMYQNGFPWYSSYVPDVKGIVTSDCDPGEVGAQRPVYGFDEIIQEYEDLEGPIVNTVSNLGFKRLKGTQTWSMDTPFVAEQACVSATDTSECYTSFSVVIEWDLTRISADDPQSQFPSLKLRNDAKGRDVVTVRTDPPVRNTRVYVETIDSNGVSFSDAADTNGQGVAVFTFRDRAKTEPRWYIADVSPRKRIMPGTTKPKRIR